MRTSALMASVFLIGLFSLSRPEASDVSIVHQEKIVRLHYEVKCDENATFHGIHGVAGIDGRDVRFDLFEERRETEFLLGAAERIESLRFEQNASCQLMRYTSEVRNEKNVILAHAPVIVVRNNQLHNRSTDLPLMLAYSTRETKNGTTLKYTLFLSDEDSLWTDTETEAQMTRYGRRTDIEWVYEVDLDKSGQPLSRRYHGGLVGGIGHATKPFKGEFLPGTLHPILYNNADHNVMSDSGTVSLPEYRLVPREELPPEFARERLMFKHPWMFSQSDDDLRRERRLRAPFTEYLYVGIQGSLTRGKVLGKIKFEDGEIVYSGHGEGSLDRLGEDLWGTQSYTAIPVGERRLEGLGERVHGEFTFVRTSLLQPQFDVKALSFFRFTNGVAETITPRFACRYAALSTTCTF